MKRILLASFCWFVFATLSAQADEPVAKPVRVKFDLLPTMHIVIKIKINDKGPYRVIFDTGAPLSLINTKTAKATGLINKNTPKPFFSLFTAVAPTLVKKLEIGDLRAASVPVVVMDHPTVQIISDIFGPTEGIIGFPFFDVIA